jgi:hydrogenase nickel incorporation protein HypB
MCATCGCGGEARLEGEPARHRHHPAEDLLDAEHARLHALGIPHEHGPHGHGPQGHGAHQHEPDEHEPHEHRPEGRLLRLERDLLAKNDAIAAEVRARLAARGILALNLVSSPGAGKTTLLERTIRALAGRLPIAVVEGDQATSNDAERIRATGTPAVQVNTGKGCHLDAAMVARALDRLDPPAGALLLIENVGNLVCPAGFDLGEAHKVVLCSLAEGDDKPLKYPTIFAAASLLLVTKTDLAPYLDADPAVLIANARRVRPDIQAIRLSARTGEGLERWLAWIEAARALRAAAAE